METPVKLGLLGRNISYSFSKKYFTEKFRKLFLRNYSYEVFDRENLDDIRHLLSQPDLRGFNVTIPFKEAIIAYLDLLSDEAQIIGAVNTVKIENGKTTGYNTDAYGFEKTLLLHRRPHHEKALVLGNGGAAKAVHYVLDQHNIPFTTVYRKGKINFDNLTADMVAQHPLIIQCTPVGTFPNVGECLTFPFDALSPNHLVIDLVYNPAYTEFIRRAAENGAKTSNGYFMLEQQAEKAWKIWVSE